MADDKPVGSPQVRDVPTPREPNEIAALIREEIDRSNKYLEFAQGQINQDRSFYKHLYTFTGAFIALLIAIAGYFQYASVTKMRSDIKSSVDSELDRNRAEIAALRAQADATGVEAQATVQKELANVLTEVQARIESEFRTENITALENAAAKNRTEKELTTTIRIEAASQVSQGIQAEQPFIKSTVENQTKQAVKDLQPTISSAVNAATQAQVEQSVAPIRLQMSQYGETIRIGNQATLARAEDRFAFDCLVQVSLGNKPESKNPELLRLANETAGAIIAEEHLGLHMGMNFKQPQAPESMKKFMVSTNPGEREAALDNYPQSDKSILPLLVQMIRGDGNLNVVYKAVGRFNSLTGQSFEFWKESELLSWWDKNQTSFQDGAAAVPK
jgi:hypothetical protein